MVDERAVLNYRCERTIAIVGALLMIGKFFAFVITGSVSILTDALESIVNVVAGMIGVYALWLCLHPADKEHPYGHGKVELISSIVEGMMIFFAGGLIIIESVQRFLNPSDVRELDIGLIVVVIAALVNFAMGSRAIRLGRKHGSIALEASGKHLCTDTYSSVGIIIGLGLMLLADFLGYDAWWLDPATAILFGVFIIYTGVNVMLKSAGRIMDASDRKVLVEVTRAFNHARAPEVIDMHHLRVVSYGSLIHVEAHMVVPDDTPMVRVDEIRGAIEAECRRVLGPGADITLQAESCDRMACKHCRSDDCSHRAGEFRSNVFLDVDTVILENAPSQRPRPNRKGHSSIRKDKK